MIGSSIGAAKEKDKVGAGSFLLPPKKAANTQDGTEKASIG